MVESKLRRRLLSLSFSIVASVVRANSAFAGSLDVIWNDGTRNPARALMATDLDDDNDDAVPDALESSIDVSGSNDELVNVTLVAPHGAHLRVATSGHIALVTGARVAQEISVVMPANGHTTIKLIGQTPSTSASDSLLTVQMLDTVVRVPITVAHLAVLNGRNESLWAHRDAVTPTHDVVNDQGLPRIARWNDVATDLTALRVQVWDVLEGSSGEVATPTGRVRLESGALRGESRGSTILDTLPTVAWSVGAFPEPRSLLRTGFVRLVADTTDARAPSVAGQLLRVALRQRLHVVYSRPDTAGTATTDIRVFRPGNEEGILSARRVHVHAVVMRTNNARPVIGSQETQATQLVRTQIAVANEIYLQCGITFGDASQQAVSFADPTTASLLHVGGETGFSASGGAVRVRWGSHEVGPIAIPFNSSPLDTATIIARAVERAGGIVRVWSNSKTDVAANATADLQVLTSNQRPTRWEDPRGGPLSTDTRQAISITTVDLSNGLEEFNNSNSAAGTNEERTMLRTFMDDDPHTLDWFFVNHFTSRARIGEAFVPGGFGSIFNAVVIDRAGVAMQRESWTQSHESGHVLLNQPWHPDNLGPDQPTLLMDADAARASVLGPKRLTLEECSRMRSQSATLANIGLLEPFDLAVRSPQANLFVHWPAAPLHPLPRVETPVAVSAPARPLQSSNIRILESE